MIDISLLPNVLAGINTVTAAVLIVGYVSIRGGNRVRHRACMLTAIMLAIAFLAVYVVYHVNVGFQAFRGHGTARILFFILLGSHMLGAMAVLVLAPVTALRALGGRFDRHRRLARKTLPVWLYVSVTGVIAHILNYYVYPAP